MNKDFDLPSWMSLGVAHAHEIMLKIAREGYEPEEGSYFVNSEISPSNPLIPKNRFVRLNIELDEEGNIIDDTPKLSKRIKR